MRVDEGAVLFNRFQAKSVLRDIVVLKVILKEGGAEDAVTLVLLLIRPETNLASKALAVHVLGVEQQVRVGCYLVPVRVDLEPDRLEQLLLAVGHLHDLCNRLQLTLFGPKLWVLAGEPLADLIDEALPVCLW